MSKSFVNEKSTVTFALAKKESAKSKIVRGVAQPGSDKIIYRESSIFYKSQILKIGIAYPSGGRGISSYEVLC